MDEPPLSRIRREIDRLDDEIVDLLAKRQAQVRLAAGHKVDEAAVRAPERRARVERRVAERARLVGLDESVAAQVWSTMIDGFVALELRAHASGVPDAKDA